MSYMRDSRTWFEEALASSITDEGERKEMVNAIANRLLESYRNGLEVGKKQCPKCNPAAGKSWKQSGSKR